VTFAVSIIIARMIGPADVGLFVLAFSLNELLNVITAFSVGMALIQFEDESQQLYDSALVLLGVLGILGLLAAAAASAGLLHFHSATAAWFILILGCTRMFDLLVVVPLAKMERGLQFGKMAALMAVTANLGNAAGVGLAWSGFGAWSLLGRELVISSLRIVGAFALADYRFQRTMGSGEARRLMSFSRRVFPARAIDITFERMDRVAVGTMFGVAALGLYQQAKMLAETGTLVMKPVSQLTLNMYSRLRSRATELRASFRVVNHFGIRVTLAGAAVLLVYPEEVIRLLLGPGWVDAAPMLRWLAVYAGLVPFLENVKQLLYAQGMLARSLQLRIIQVGTVLLALALAALRGEVMYAPAGLLAGTILGLAAGLLFVRDVARPILAGILLRPLIAFTVTCGGMLLLAPELPVPPVLHVLLPFAAFLVLVAVLDGPQNVREVSLLYRHLRDRAETSAAPAPVAPADQKPIVQVKVQ
jgi:polysaccharide transporter, PST family